jgi:hypothetical protein
MIFMDGGSSSVDGFAKLYLCVAPPLKLALDNFEQRNL